MECEYPNGLIKNKLKKKQKKKTTNKQTNNNNNKNPKTITYAKISPKMVNSKDIAGNTKRRRRRRRRRRRGRGGRRRRRRRRDPFFSVNWIRFLKI